MVESPSNALKKDIRGSAGAARDVAPRPLELPADTARAAPASTRPTAPPTKTKGSPLATALFSAAVLATLYKAWSVSDEQYIIAGSGLGYWLGIVGSLMMLVLIFYPLRKKYAKNQNLGRIASWFKSHMVMGIVGPALIMIHSNFELKSVNATVATVVMLTVVFSGIVGRFLYSKIHRGLYGAKAEAKTLLAEADAFKHAFDDDLGAGPETLDELKGYEAAILNQNMGLIESTRLMWTLGYRTRVHRKTHILELQAAIAARALREHWDDEAYQKGLHDAREHLDLYNIAVRKAAGLKFYDRLFGWWHVLHMPLFFLLILTAILHVIAVHLY